MRPWLILFAFIAIAAGVWWGSVRNTKGALELTQASVWADLQGIEAEHRADKHLHVPVFLKEAVDDGRYDVVGLRSDSMQFPYVWIVLNANARANGIYSMPHDTNFTLACSEVDTLSTQTTLDSTVAAALKAHCAQ